MGVPVRHVRRPSAHCVFCGCASPSRGFQAGHERVLRELFDPRNDIPADSALLAPLRARLGIVPLLNWNLAEGLESRFWASSTPSNTLLLTWQKVLLGR